MTTFPRHRLRMLLFSMLLLLSSHTLAASKSGGSGGGGTKSGGSSTSTSSGSASVRGKSYGVTSLVRIASAVVLLNIWMDGFTYPGMRFYYTDYYDDCAFRNITSIAAGGSGTAIDDSAVALLSTIASSSANQDIMAFNQTLFNTTNGLIVDSAYCNYTSTTTTTGASAASGCQLPALLLTVMLTTACLSLCGLRRGLS